MEHMLGQAGADPSTWFAQWGRTALITTAVAISLTVPLRIVVSRFRRRLEQTPSTNDELNMQRIGTLTTALSTTGIVVIWSVAVLIVLDTMGVPLAPLFASAGIAGVALGFGAQSIVRDTLSGFFILLENQFCVGDIVELRTSANPVEGKVEALTLRVTSLRSFDGTLHTVPNGNIQLVSNRSRGWARAIVDIRLAFGEDVSRVRGLLEDLFESLQSDSVLSDWIQDGPRVLGVERMSDYALVVRVVAETHPANSLATERALRERIMAKLEAAGIRTPLPPAVATMIDRGPV